MNQKQLHEALNQGRAAWAVAAPGDVVGPLAVEKRGRAEASTGTPRSVSAERATPGPRRRRTAARALVQSAHEVLRPAYQRQPTPPSRVPAWPRAFVANPEASLEERLADLERGTRRAMGTVALRGIEWGVRIGFSVGGVASLALAFIPGALLPIPALGVVVVAAPLMLGLLVGAAAQAIARARFARRHPGFAEEVLGSLLQVQAELLAERPSDEAERDAQVRQLRRIELLQRDVEGGLRHGAWQALFALTNVDPRLRVWMSAQAKKFAAAEAKTAAQAT